MKKHLSKILAIAAFVFFIQNNSFAQGTWSALAHAAPDLSGGQMILLTDGTVMCLTQNDTISNSGIGNVWDLLTPDIHGSYANGTWTRLPAMHDTRLYMGCQVLPNGNLYVAGGQYGTGDTTGEVFNTTTQKWTYITGVPHGLSIANGNSELLYDGTVLQGVQVPTPSVNTLIFNSTTTSFTAGPQSLGSHDNVSWVKLPDSSIINVDKGTQISERYIPQISSWISDGPVSTALYDGSLIETGPGFLLPNGKVFFLGDAVNTAYYAPTGNLNAGIWSTGPQMPVQGSTQLGCPGASAAMMPNGLIVCDMSAAGSTSAPTYFYVFDYNTNAFTQIQAPAGGNTLSDNSMFTSMLDLPDGTVLFSHYGISGENVYYQFTPTAGPLAAGKPVISNVSDFNCTTYRITGKLFNGISEGAAFGSNWAMASNYPIVRLTNGTNVYYAKTTNWNRMGAVMTDSLKDTAYFTIPTIPAGTYSLVLVANGNPSNPTLFTPYEASASVTANVNCNGSNNGNATATVGGGVMPYTYQWSNGSTTVSNTNPTGTILSAGSYTVTITDNIGCTKTSTVSITEPAPLTVVPRVATNISCHGGSNGSVGATPSGGTGPYTYLWSGGGTGATKSGLSIGSYTITISDSHGCTTTAATAAITQPTAIAIAPGSTEGTWPSYCNGSAWVTVTGGTGPYNYFWSPSGLISDTITNQCAGSNCCLVTDNNGCVDSLCVTIVTAVQNVSHANVISVYPNPNNGTFAIQSSVANNQSLVEVYNVLGEQILNQKLTGSTNQINLSAQSSGVYLYRILSQSGGVLSTGKFVIQK